VFRDTIIVGAGQAGLSLAYYLEQHGEDYLLLDAAETIGESWRRRYDSLVLFTPSQYNSLPGLVFPAAPDTYPAKDEVANYLHSYAEHFHLRIKLRTKVTYVGQIESGFRVETTQGTFRASRVIIATGALHRPVVPSFAASLSPVVYQLHSSEYRNPQQLNSGDALIVGAGNSGIQIAAELSRDRRVSVAIGKRPRCVPQRFLGRDIFWWLSVVGMMDATPDSWLWGRSIRANNPIIGLVFWRLRLKSQIVCLPRVTGAHGNKVWFQDGSSCRVSNVIWATGYRYDFSWIHIPVFDTQGKPVQRRGMTKITGLYFLGLQWLHTGSSGFLGFVAKDSEFLAQQLARRAPVVPPITDLKVNPG
jgi:putative flavoprotein involved in K+ transport